jgi:hypothetical protein
MGYQHLNTILPSLAYETCNVEAAFRTNPAASEHLNKGAAANISATRESGGAIIVRGTDIFIKKILS